MSDQAWRDHDSLMDGCECLDRIVDSSPDDQRRTLSQAIIESLREGTTDGYDFSPELHQQIEDLIDIFSRYNEPEYFISRAERIFAIAEELRLTDCRDHYVDRVCEEGRCFLEMFLPIFATHATPEFMHFFPHVAEVGNLVDKLVDARADYKRGEIRLHPGASHFARLLKEIAIRSRTAFVRFPNKPRLFFWAIRFFDPRRHVSAMIS